MFKYILQSEGDINLLALILLMLFFVVFIFSIVLILTKDKKYIDKMSNLPFEDDKEGNGH